jgi:hypothetical protein
MLIGIGIKTGGLPPYSVTSPSFMLMVPLSGTASESTLTVVTDTSRKAGDIVSVGGMVGATNFVLVEREVDFGSKGDFLRQVEGGILRRH